jgi:hypothetical protein
MRRSNKPFIAVGLAAAISSQCFAPSMAQDAADMAAPDDYGLVFAALGELSGGFRHADSTDYVNLSGGMFSGAARASIPVMERFSVQLDGDVEVYLSEDGQSWEPLGLWLAGGHANWRDPSRGLIGLFGAAGYGLQSGFDNSRDYEVGYMFGAEGQIYFGDFTLYAQAGYGDFESDNEPEGFIEGWFLRGVGRWFPNEDSLVEAELSYGQTSQFVDAVDDGKIWNWGLQGKMRMSEALPLYGTAAYRGGYYDATTAGDDGSEHMLMVGVNVLFGADSLKANDRLGATLNLPRLPTRSAPWGEGLD